MNTDSKHLNNLSKPIIGRAFVVSNTPGVGSSKSLNMIHRASAPAGRLITLGTDHVDITNAT